MRIFPSGRRLFFILMSKVLISLILSKWIVCLTKIRSNFFLFVKKKDKASVFLKLILSSLSLWLTKSIPIGLFISFNLELKEPMILPRPHPISKIFELELSLFAFVKKILKFKI